MSDPSNNTPDSSNPLKQTPGVSSSNQSLSEETRSTEITQDNEFSFLNKMQQDISRNCTKAKHLRLIRSTKEEFYHAIKTNYNIKRRKDIKKIDIQNCRFINEIGLKALHEARSSGLARLKSFRFTIFRSDIKDNGLELLGKALSSGLINLNSLELAFEQLEGLSDIGITKFAHLLTLANFQSLERFKIRFFNHNYLLQQGTVSLWSAIRSRSMSWLSSLEIDLTNCVSRADDGLEGLDLAIRRRARKLEHLVVTLSQCSRKLTNKGLQILSKGLKSKLTSLEDVSITFKVSPEYIGGIKSLADGIHTGLSKLKSLKLNIETPDPNIDSEIGLFGDIIYTGPPNIQNLEFSFNFTNATDAGFEVFEQNLSKGNPNVQSLVLVMKDNKNISNISMQTLSKAISEGLPNLKKLHLDFTGCAKIEKIPAILANEKLETLCLFFDRCPYNTNEGILDLNNDLISKKPRDLKCLNYSFNQCTTITDTSLVSISDVLKSGLTNLEIFDLSFMANAKITETGLISIYKSLQNPELSKLRRLKIAIANGNTITDNSLAVLSETICKHLTQLRYLEVNLGNQKVTDKGVESLTEAIKVLCPILESLTITFPTKAITNKSLTALSDVLSLGLPNLSFLKLGVATGEGLTDDGFVSLFEAFEKGTVNIRTFNLTICYTGLKDMGIKALCQAMNKRLQNMTHCNLNLSNNSQISDTGIKELEEVFATGFEELDEITITIDQCSKVHFKAKQGLKNALLGRKYKSKIAFFDYGDLYW